MKRLILAALLLTACQRDSRYFGNTTPPAGQRLVYANAGEPDTLDPAFGVAASDNNVVGTLFEGLVLLNPKSTTPMAGMATHYEQSADGKEYTFYLRGHRAPKGTRLPDIQSLPPEFSHGAQAPPDAVPAHWSDGSVVNAADFVYSWRRFADPRVASPLGRDFALLVNGREILAGKRPPDQLGVEALDDFTLRVQLEAIVPDFLQSFCLYSPVPREVVERARREGREASWTQPGRMVSNGPFVLKEWRPYDYLKVVRNPNYYERDSVRLDEISFLPIGAGAAVMNLYQAGVVQSMDPTSLQPALIPAFKATPDFRSDPDFDVDVLLVNLHQPPFDNPMLRWAINMALDKGALADFSFASPVRQLVPRMSGYTPPERVIVEVKGKKYDVLAHDPAGARELLAAAGYPGGIDRQGKPLTFAINQGHAGDARAEIIRYQLQAALNVDVRVKLMEFQVLDAAQRAGTLQGLSLMSLVGSSDPTSFVTPDDLVGWHDRAFDAALKDANATLDPGIRMKKLAQCEYRLLEAMPLIPMTSTPNMYLAKPYLRGFVNLSFRYAWIYHATPNHNFKETNQR